MCTVYSDYTPKALDPSQARGISQESGPSCSPETAGFNVKMLAKLCTILMNFFLGPVAAMLLLM